MKKSSPHPGNRSSNERTPAGAEGVRPMLSELIALRAAVTGKRAARHGRHGMSGIAVSPLRGRGMEYAESREYTVGDDARHIDWRLTARSGRPHTKLFQAERERLTLLVADTAAGLYFGTRARFKSVQAARAGAVAAWAAVRDGDRIAALRGTHAEPPVSPAAGPRGALRVLDALVRWYAQPPVGDRGLALALEEAMRLLRPGSRLVVLSDPPSLATIQPFRWSALARHPEVTVLMLVDPLERDPPQAALTFASGGHRVELDLANTIQRRRWRHTFSDPVDDALQRLPPLGVRVQVLMTDAPSESWLPMAARISGGVS